MIPTPITRALSSMKRNGVRSLLMGGQACVLYGAAEFSRDLDLAIQVDQENLANLKKALAEMQAEVIAVPPFEREYLERGHAVHFRSQIPEMHRLRIDIMTRMRGVDSFPVLWERRTVINVGDLEIDLLSIGDLIAAKRTQRDKDWPMTNRLVEAHYLAHKDESSAAFIRFWLTESFDLSFLNTLVQRYPTQSANLREERPILQFLTGGNLDKARILLQKERRAIEVEDENYWAPLIKELHSLRGKR